MVDINKKLNKKDFYLDDAETVIDYIRKVLTWHDEFYYKNISYEIINWDGKNWAFQVNAFQDEEGPKPHEIFFEGTEEGFAKALETLTLHDGTLLYDAITKPGYDKFFGYNPNIKY